MKQLLITTAVFCSITLNAQERGNIAYDASNNVYAENSVYGNYNYGYPRYSHTGNNSQQLPNDSVYTLNARVLINLTPDIYVAVFNVQQEALTVAQCTKLITERIDKFKT
ncbi:MAG: hypothetical protein ACHQF2_11860, partial [Flavobacteriales bacterium]